MSVFLFQNPQTEQQSNLWRLWRGNYTHRHDHQMPQHCPLASLTTATPRCSICVTTLAGLYPPTSSWGDYLVLSTLHREDNFEAVETTTTFISLTAWDLKPPWKLVQLLLFGPVCCIFTHLCFCTLIVCTVMLNIRRYHGWNKKKSSTTLKVRSELHCNLNFRVLHNAQPWPLTVQLPFLFSQHWCTSKRRRSKC